MYDPRGERRERVHLESGKRVGFQVYLGLMTVGRWRDVDTRDRTRKWSEEVGGDRGP